MTVFGAIVTGDQVEDAVVAQLKLWLPTYIAELARQTARPGSIPAPRSYIVSGRFQRRRGDQLPSCVVVSPGTASEPVRAGDGTVSAWFRIEVGVAVTGKTADDANALAKLYAAAVRALLLQKPSLGGIASAVTLIGESYDDLPTTIVDVGAYALVLADVKVASIADTTGGPAVPDLDPGDWPEIDAVNITIQKEPIA